MDYTVKLHEHETMNFKWDETRPFVKRTFEETYVLPGECVLEEIVEMLDVPSKRIETRKDIDYSLFQCMDDAELDRFIEKNNRLFDFWQKTKPQIEEWMVLYAERKNACFKHFTINLENLSWCNHTCDTAEDEDKAYIDISAI